MPEKSLRATGKAFAELAPDVYTDLKVYSTRAPTVRSSSRRARPSRLLSATCRALRYVPPEKLRLRRTQGTATPSVPLNARPVSMTRRKELEHRAATYCRKPLFFKTPRRSSTTVTTGSILGRRPAPKPLWRP